MKRRLTFDVDERARLREVTAILGVTFEEFVHHATLHAVDEVLGAACELSIYDHQTVQRLHQVATMYGTVEQEGE